MFIDEIEIILKSGKGGNGLVSFFPGEKSGPDGGNGGDGGDLYVYGSSHITNLNNFLGKKILSAENGQNGDKNKMSGRKGADLEIAFPVGSFLTDLETGKEIELINEGERVLICKGGRGGKGNFDLRSSSNTTPRKAQKGESGYEKHFKIIVRLIADFGLIGLPNAGKSSLLNELTNANVRVANYPFTTLEPNLGAFNGKIFADIPGLIEGAHEGKGLGIKFLKHIEKVQLLLHCISSESMDVIADYKIIMTELESWNQELTKKHQIVLLTKSDLIDPKVLEKKIKLLKKYQKNVLPVSIHDWDSLDRLKQLLQI